MSYLSYLFMFAHSGDNHTLCCVFGEVSVLSKPGKSAILYMRVISIYPLFLRYFDWFLELFRQCGILELFRQCGILELFRQCGILELFRQCGILELFRQCGILELFRQSGNLELFRQCGILELFRQCGSLELFRQCGNFSFTIIVKVCSLNIYHYHQGL
jgi:hypothetical protein